MNHTNLFQSAVFSSIGKYFFLVKASPFVDTLWHECDPRKMMEKKKLFIIDQYEKLGEINMKRREDSCRQHFEAIYSFTVY